MLVVHGIYEFAPKGHAFRNDYCLTCHCPRIALQVRSFYVLHIYWVPLIPLGFWKRWICSACGREPHELGRTRRSIKVLLAAVLLLVGFPIWMIQPQPGQGKEVWIFRAIWLGVTLASLWWATYGHRPVPNLRKLWGAIEPYEERTCPFCNGEMSPRPTIGCPSCDLKLLELRR